MMRLGRLKYIESYTARPVPSAAMLQKFVVELAAEVHRLRSVLDGVAKEPNHEIAVTWAKDALIEPPLGPPDFIRRA